MTTITVTRADAGTTDAVAAIWYAGWLDAHTDNVPIALVEVRSRESFSTRARARISDTLIARDGAEVIGFAMTCRDELEQLYIARDRRGSGTAELLIAAAERSIADAGHDRAWLAVVSQNVRARRFYERVGWADGGDFTYEASTDSGSVEVPCRKYMKHVVSASGK
jgi:GNAT superfamily N-acetyltransferase